MQQDLFAWVLSVHGLLLPLSLAGLYRYSDRTAPFKRTIGDTDQILDRMMRRVATAMEEQLAPVIQRAQGVPRIVSPESYTERPVDPVRSDAFREAIHQFVHSDINALADYNQVYRARLRWSLWARLLSWNVLCLSLWEATCLGLLGVFRTIQGITIPEPALQWSLIPTALLIVTFFSCNAVLLRQSDVIHDHQTRNPEL